MQFLLVLGLMLYSNFVSARSLELKKNDHIIYIEENNEWQLGKDLFGMPFIYFSPQLNGQRSNISFTDTKAKLELESKDLRDSQKKYQNDRQKWLSQINGSPLEFYPYEFKINKRGHKYHKIGFSYLHEGRKYVEYSHYIECRGRIIFSKSLRLKENNKHDKDFDSLIQSLDCGGV